MTRDQDQDSIQRRTSDTGRGEAASGSPVRLMTIAEAAAYLNIPRTTLRDYVTERRVPFTRIGRRHVRFTPDHLAAIIAAGEQPVRQQTRPTGRPRRPPAT